MKQQNPFAFAKPITLENLGDLFAHHRALTGGWTMTQGDPEPEPDPSAAPPPGPAATFAPITSQEELDRVLGQRLVRERAKFSDYDDLKRKADAHDQALEAAKSESEKAIDAARAEGEKTAIERSNGRLIKAEARALAATANFRDPADAVAFLDLSAVSVSEDGEVDAEAITERLKALAERKPYLVGDGRPPAPKPDRSQGSPRSTKSTGVKSGRELFEERRAKKTT